MAHHALSSCSLMERNWGWTTSEPPQTDFGWACRVSVLVRSRWLNVMQKENRSAETVACSLRDTTADWQKKEKIIGMPVKLKLFFRSKYSSWGSGSRRNHRLRYMVTDVTPLHRYRRNKALPFVHFACFFFFPASWKNPVCLSRVCVSSWPRQSYARRWNGGKFTGN